MKKVCIVLAGILAACAPAEEQFAPEHTREYSIHATSLRQPIEGWGVSLCWWARMCGTWSEERVDSLIDWMVSSEGLNWNIFRYNIGGGDDPVNAHCEPHHMGKGKGLRAEMEGFQDEPGGPYHWERDAGQRRIMLKIKERRPDAIFEAFSNSAPWWMTLSGCCGGNTPATADNLNPAYYEAFAHYLVDVCKHYKEVYGIEFKTLEPFNEPVTDYWYAGGSQEGCHFSAEEQAKFVEIIQPILAASGLNTVLACADETNTMQSVKTLQHYIHTGAIRHVGQWNTHTYGADNRTRSQVGTLARAAGKTVWMDEVGSGGNGIKGNLDLCQKLFDDQHYMLPSAWIDWQYVEEHGDQWCLVHGIFSDETTMARVPHYWVRQQVSRFFRPGYHMVSSLSSKALAAVNPAADTLVVALLNNDSTRLLHRIDLPGIRIDKPITLWRTMQGNHMQPLSSDSLRLRHNTLSIALPPLSLTTLVLPISPSAPKQNGTLENGTYLIVPQSNCELALAVDGQNIVVNKADLTNKNQRWKLRRKEAGYTLTSETGLTITATADYPLQATPQPSGTSLFNIQPVDDYFFRINISDSLAFDLQHASLSAGTIVGSYPYGDSPVADTRHWQFIRITK